MYGNEFERFEEMLTSIETWIDVAPADGFDPEGIEFVREFIVMLKERVQNLRVQDQSNSEIYRQLHVEKNII